VARKRLHAERPAARAEPSALRLSCIFYRADSGNEPVREWLKDTVPAGARKTIGGDIKTVQAMWPLDKPLVDHLGAGLWEVCSTHDKIEYRVIVTLAGSTMVLLHGFIKTSTKTRKADIDLALKREGKLGENEMKNKHVGSTLDSLFEELGELEEVNALAAKKILALQTERRMKELGLTTTTLAARMGTSRNQVHRVLDEDDAGITLKVLFRLSKALQMPLRVTFDEAPFPRRAEPRRARTKAHERRASKSRGVVKRITERRRAG
jgi:phage-related protein/transcriptional regulator with XRE-family HTH domain